jgi:predicted DNA-binding protein
MRLTTTGDDRIISLRLGLDLDLRVTQMAAAVGHPRAWVLRKLIEGRLNQIEESAQTRDEVLLALYRPPKGRG